MHFNHLLFSAVEYLNMIFFNSEKVIPHEHIDIDQLPQKTFWKTEMRELLQKKFGNCLTEEELNEDDKLFHDFCNYKLFEKVQEITGIQISAAVNSNFAHTGFLLVSDVVR